MVGDQVGELLLGEHSRAQFLRLGELGPRPWPATRMVVFFDTLPEELPPALLTSSFISLRFLPARGPFMPPVMTTT